MEQLVVYNDLRKLTAISVSYALIGACIVWLGFTQGDGILWRVLSVLIAACFIAGIELNTRKMMNRSPLIDYTLVITLPWSQVLNVQLKAANTNDLMLDVTGFRTADQLDEITPEMQAQMDANGTDRVYYMLELSGLWVRRQRIQDAFDWLRDNVGERFPDIVFTGFEDPLSKVGRKAG